MSGLTMQKTLKPFSGNGEGLDAQGHGHAASRLTLMQTPRRRIPSPHILQGMKTLPNLFSAANARASRMEWGRKRRDAGWNKFTYPLQVTKICDFNSEQADERLDEIGFMDKHFSSHE